MNYNNKNNNFFRNALRVSCTLVDGSILLMKIEYKRLEGIKTLVYDIMIEV